MPSARLPNHLRGHRLKATELNVVNREVERLGRIRVEVPLEIVDGPSGPLIRLAGVFLKGRWAVTGGSGIPARVVNTPGSATVTRTRYDGSVISASSETFVCKNRMKSAIGANREIFCVWEDGAWWIVDEDCS